jgi:hypothetical protein
MEDLDFTRRMLEAGKLLNILSRSPRRSRLRAPAGRRLLDDRLFGAEAPSDAGI